MKAKNLFLIIVLLLAILSCKKQHRYPEDPKRTFDSPKTRLVGIWNIYEYTLNGNSILDPANFGGADITTYFRIQYRKDYTELIQPFDNESFLTFGPFQNVSNCNYIKIFITPLKCTNTSTAADWTITKLYNGDLHLIHQTDTGEFKLFFKKTHN